jgi:hypothetical protein
MPCYGPLTAYRPKATANDKRLVFKKSDAETGVGIKIPCGKCPGCKLEHSRQWAVRCMHEKRLHTDSCFVTLTYSDDNLPPGNTLVLADLQNFLKRLRHETGPNLRFFACGEYGSRTSRPHYHLLLLNSDFADKRIVSRGSQYNLYESPLLSRLWPAGHHALGDVTFESAAYVARYCMKKNQNGKTVNDGRLPEFITMSRRPGLGAGYFEKFRSELISHDTIIVNGVAAALPRFYDNKLAGLTDAFTENTGLHVGFELVKARRRRKILWSQRADNSVSRLRVREVVALAKLRLKGQTL